MDSEHEIFSKSPDNCSTTEIRDFITLVELGGEVVPRGLEDRVRSAAQLAFLRIDGRIAGIAALKHPKAAYRSRVAAAAGIELPSTSFQYELGWVFVTADARGNGYAKLASQAALSHAVAEGVFATSRADNAAMHRTLAKLGFTQSGVDYASRYGLHHLKLFTRVP